MATHSSPNFHSFKEKSSARRARRVVAAFLIFSAVLTSAYTALSLYIATQLVYAPQQPLYATPALFGMQFHRITFPSREDHVQLRGWFIPGVLPGGHLTAQRTIIMVHGDRTNRADQGAGLLKLSVAFAQHGFAVLAFDMRGAGESAPAPLSLGYFEQRDVLGAVDFLRSKIALTLPPICLCWPQPPALLPTRMCRPGLCQVLIMPSLSILRDNNTLLA